MKPECHHPPFAIIAPGPLTREQWRACSDQLTSEVKPGEAYAMLGLGDAYLQVIECSHCRAPLAPPPDGDAS